MVEANFDLPYANAIVQLLDQTVGVFYHVHDAYQEMPGVDRVIIFGSWAARYHGPAGPPPNDVDIAVVGSMDPFDARVAGTMIENRSRVTVQVVTFTYAEWDAPSRGSFVDTIKQRPTVVVLDRTERGKDDAEHSESGNRVESA